MAVWEVDFCSRPLLDGRGKKVWELLVCDGSGRELRYAQFFPNNRINSAELSAALARLASALGGAPPATVRFFRAQMQTIISRACAELGATPLASRRCFALQAWLAQRSSQLYPALPNFDSAALPLPAYEPGAPAPLPDALRGESWAFVQLPLRDVLAESARVAAGQAFGSCFSPDTGGLSLSGEDTVPGVLVFSKRADALAGWMNGLEIAALTPEPRSSTLLLDTGVAVRWAYATWRPSPSFTAEAQAWEEGKRAAGGLHFLAVSQGAESDCAGFWMCL